MLVAFSIGDASPGDSTQSFAFGRIILIYAVFAKKISTRIALPNVCMKRAFQTFWINLIRKVVFLRRSETICLRKSDRSSILKTTNGHRAGALSFLAL